MAVASRVDVQGYLAHKNPPPLGPYSRTMPRALWQSSGGGQFLMSEVPLYSSQVDVPYHPTVLHMVAPCGMP